MLNIKYGDSSYKIRNEIDEINIKDYENILNIFNNNEFDSIEKWVKLFNYLGLPDDVKLDIDDLTKISSKFKFINNDIPLTKIYKYINIDGEKIYFKNDKLKFKVIDLIDIIGCDNNMSQIISILYPNSINNKDYLCKINEQVPIRVLLPILNTLKMNIII